MAIILAKDFTLSDVERIDELFQKQDEFGIPSLKNVFTNMVVESPKGEVLGYGVVKLFAEAFMILDPESTKKQKAATFKELMRAAILRSKNANLEQLFVVSNDQSFSTILCNKYAFKRVPGELLMLDLTTEESEDGQ